MKLGSSSGYRWHQKTPMALEAPDVLEDSLEVTRDEVLICGSATLPKSGIWFDGKDKNTGLSAVNVCGASTDDIA
jgi:hypothetical protein